MSEEWLKIPLETIHKLYEHSKVYCGMNQYLKYCNYSKRRINTILNYILFIFKVFPLICPPPVHITVNIFKNEKSV